MKYNFYIHKNEQFGWEYFRLNVENSKFSTLQNILTSDDWTPQKVQIIIDGVEKHKTLPDNETDNPFVWGNEDVSVLVNENGVTLMDTLAIRAGESSQDKIVLELTHEEFIQFLEDFKQFVTENS